MKKPMNANTTSEKRRWPLAEAEAVACHLRDMLAPSCKKIVIAGSIRRRKPYVGDIELLFVPRLTALKADFFVTTQIDIADRTINDLLAKGILAKRLSVTGHEAWGPKNKLAVHVPSGIPVDLFSTTEDNWYVALVIRTGSKATNLRLTMGANKQGRILHAYGSGVEESDGNIIPATSEEHVFQLCGIPFMPPEKR